MPVVLVVDDDDDLRTSVAEALRTEGYTVRCASNGKQALGLLFELRPDIVLLDLVMPVMGGMEFMEHKRKDPAVASIPVVVASASRVSNLEGASAVLRKPVGMKEVFGALENALRLRQRALV
jgi:two-component system, OmpR family, response regulator CpxR